MGEEWRALARRVPAILAPIGAVDEGSMDSRLPKLIHGASDALRLRWDDLASFRHGVPHVLDPLQQPVLPAVLLGRATAEIGHHHELHCAGARVFALYGEHLGFLQPAPVFRRDLVLHPGPDQVANAWWENWLRNRAEAFDSKREVCRRLRFAAAYDTAVMDAVSVARMLPAGSPYWDAWIRAAEFLAVDAEGQASAAVDDAYKMRGAVFMESYSATSILGRT